MTRAKWYSRPILLFETIYVRFLASLLLTVFLSLLYFPQAKGESMMDWSNNLEESLDNEARRLTEILNELGRIGKILEESATRVDPEAPEEELLKVITLEINRTRVPGFCAYNLAEEALSLLKLLSVRIALLERNKEKSRDAKLQRKLDNLKEIINETEPKVRQTIEQMKPWSGMEGKKIAEAIAARAAARRK